MNAIDWTSFTGGYVIGLTAGLLAWWAASMRRRL
jgi:hypothetical protein